MIKTKQNIFFTAGTISPQNLLQRFWLSTEVLRKIVGKTKIDTIRSQQIRESYGIQPINEWVERRRRE